MKRPPWITTFIAIGYSSRAPCRCMSHKENVLNDIEVPICISRVQIMAEDVAYLFAGYSWLMAWSLISLHLKGSDYGSRRCIPFRRILIAYGMEPDKDCTTVYGNAWSPMHEAAGLQIQGARAIPGRVSAPLKRKTLRLTCILISLIVCLRWAYYYIFVKVKSLLNQKPINFIKANHPVKAPQLVFRTGLKFAKRVIKWNRQPS